MHIQSALVFFISLCALLAQSSNSSYIHPSLSIYPHENSDLNQGEGIVYEGVFASAYKVLTLKTPSHLL
jgi:sorbitol-specific phosphotransferase system component IIC